MASIYVFFKTESLNARVTHFNIIISPLSQLDYGDFTLLFNHQVLTLDRINRLICNDAWHSRMFYLSNINQQMIFFCKFPNQESSHLKLKILYGN